MAANIIEPGSSLADLASKLDLSQVPDKLHCSTCHHFLINAYRTTCCESYVCDKCFEALGDSCPVCKHKPFSPDLVRPNKAMRGTAKAYLKTVEKSQADERTRAQTSASATPTAPNVDNVEENEAVAEVVTTAEVQSEQTDHMNGLDLASEPVPEIQPSIEEATPMDDGSSQAAQALPDEPNREDRAASNSSEETDDDDDDEIEIQVEPTEGEEYQMHSNQANTYEEDTSFVNSADGNSEHLNGGKDGANGMDATYNTSNGGMGYNMNMQPMQMMQQMQQMMMGNPMMNAMGMQNMFGGFQNGGMNGMDMNMMNFANQNMFGWHGQNNNNFNNAYSNAMNGSFGPSFGFDMSQQGNFQQQFQNGDFQNGYSDYRGRGRGRFRGGRGSFRGRGHFAQFSQNNFQSMQNTYDQQQQQQQQTEERTSQNQIQDRSNGHGADHNGTDPVAIKQDQASGELTPGGQAEVQEALRDQSITTGNNNTTDSVDDTPSMDLADTNDNAKAVTGNTNGTSEISQEVPAKADEKPIPEAYHEDFDSMAPPSAPLGPSGRHSDRDFGFRSRGRGKYGPYGRGSHAQRELLPISPVKTASSTASTIPSPKQGLGVQGAPTGPRAMRDPAPSKPSPTTNGSGFQIKGQAAIQMQSQSRLESRPRSPSITNGYESSEDRITRKMSHHGRPNGSKLGDERVQQHDRGESGRSRKRSRRDDDDDYDMEDPDEDNNRWNESDRKSYRSDRNDRNDRNDRARDRDKHASRHKSFRGQYEEAMDHSYHDDEYGMEVDTNSAGHRSAGRNGRSSKQDDEERERDRRSQRDRDGERDKDRDGYKDRGRDKDERRRKRSRHDRDRDEEEDEDIDHEARHRSRRHKKEHQSSSRRDRDRDRDRLERDDLGLRISGQSSLNRNQAASALPTPTSTNGEAFESEKDPHTLEREARNRERLLKEQQRREKAAAEKNGASSTKYGRGTVSGGRKVSYKYEDEIERSMDESDRRWR